MADAGAEGIRVHPPIVATQLDGLTCLDLFAGAGGLAIGFREAGFRVVGANDADADAGATFRLNFPEAAFFEGSIVGLTDATVMKDCNLRPGDLDCLIGGPPCQSFSYNNHHRSDSDDRARLFEHYLRLVRGLQPKTLVMENVPGILTIGGGSVVNAIRAELRLMGYDTALRILSAEEYGTPQVRRRVFIVASRIGRAVTLLPSPTHNSADKRKPRTRGLKLPVTVWSAIGDLPMLANGGGRIDTAVKPVKAFSAYQRKMRKGKRKVFNHVCQTLTKVNLDRIVHVPEGGNWRDIPRNLLPAGMQRARLSDHTKRYGRLSRNGLASTLLTKCDPHWGAYVHPTQNRTISVREAARLQGFPDSFRFAGDSLARHYEQVGNAVPIPVAEAIARCVVKHLAEFAVKPATQTDQPNAGKLAA